MSIELLGILQPQVNGNLFSKGKIENSEQSFASLLGAVFSKGQQILTSEIERDAISTDALTLISELVAFLEIEELEELLGGNLLMVEASLTRTDEELFDVIVNYLQFDQVEFEEILQHYHSELIQSEDCAELNNLQMLQNLIAYFTAQTTEQFSNVYNNDVNNIVKAGKLVNLLLNYQDTDESKRTIQTKLTTDLKQFTGKLKLLFATDKQIDRQQYLQRAFATVITETTTDTNNETSQSKLTVQTARLDNTNTGQAMHLHQMPRAEQLTLMLENNGRQVTPEQLIRQFNTILSKSQFLKEAGTQRLFIKLHPEHLGALRIELVQKNQMMVARILASTAAAREMLDSQLNNLKQAFVNQNIQVERVEVSQQLAQHERFFKEENEQENQQQNERDHDNDNEVDESFGMTFEDALLNVEV